MGCCFSLCESTPDVPENIIPDPVVRFPAAAPSDERFRFVGVRLRMHTLDRRESRETRSSSTVPD